MTGPLPPPSDELNTWQEIADYLCISKREAQDREKENGMPVHRLPGKKSRVWAYRIELDTWRQRPTSAGSATVSTPVQPDLFVESPELTHKEETVSPDPRFNRRALLGGLAGAATISAVGAGWFLRRRPGDPVRVSISGKNLLAWDEAGRLAWQHQFPAPPSEDLGERRLQIVDLVGDGRKQVVLSASFPRGDAAARQDEVFCFSPEGKLVWQYKPELTFRFGDTQFKGPWLFSDMLVAHGNPPTIWLAVIHWNWRPAFVLAINPNGIPVVKFVSAGHIYSLARAPMASGACLLAGGINNEYACAALAVLREDAPPSRSPQTPGSRFECVDGPEGFPDRYFLFPPSEISVAASKPYNRVRLVQKIDSGFLVATDELLSSGESGAVELEYGFSDALEPHDVAFSDGYAGWHRHFEVEGLLKHGLAECPQLRNQVSVRRWDRKSGWMTVNIPLTSGVRPDGYRP
jgi:hypothetical protein